MSRNDDHRDSTEQELSISGRWIKTARVNEEWYLDVDDPERLVERIKAVSPRVDLFSFWQRLPDLKPHFQYHQEWESIAALPVTTYEHWYKKQINNKTRNLIVKAQKK